MPFTYCHGRNWLAGTGSRRTKRVLLGPNLTIFAVEFQCWKPIWTSSGFSDCVNKQRPEDSNDVFGPASVRDFVVEFDRRP